MVRIIDMECSIPRTEASQPEPGHDQEPAAKQPAGYGMANYSRIFKSRREGADHRPDVAIPIGSSGWRASASTPSRA